MRFSVFHYQPLCRPHLPPIPPRSAYSLFPLPLLSPYRLLVCQVLSPSPSGLKRIPSSPLIPPSLILAPSLSFLSYAMVSGFLSLIGLASNSIHKEAWAGPTSPPTRKASGRPVLGNTELLDATLQRHLVLNHKTSRRPVLGNTALSDATLQRHLVLDYKASRGRCLATPHS